MLEKIWAKAYISWGDEMKTPILFSGMSHEEIDAFTNCMGAVQKTFTIGQTIYDYGAEAEYIGLLLSGEVELIFYDLLGKRAGTLQVITPGGSFGEEYVFLKEKPAVRAICTKNCTVVFLHTESILSPCSSSCRCHKVFLTNLATLYNEKLRMQRAHLRILSCATTREKLLAFFTELSRSQDSFSCDMPFNLTRLAAYLNVNRSAMTRELSKLKAEHLIELDGRSVKINYL